MNKKDKKLIIIILIIALIFIILKKLDKKTYEYAYVYRKNEVIEKIDLSIDNTYEVEGKLGVVKIEVIDGKIRVKEEVSNYHLCSKQGFINNNESIVCLPNEIVIKLGSSKIDTISR